MKNHVAERFQMNGWGTEQEVPVPEDVKYHRHDYLVDILAKKEGRTVAIEIGQLRKREKQDIQQYVDRVLHIPYQPAQQAGVDAELHQVLTTAVGMSDDHRSVKEFVSFAVLERLQEIDDAILDMGMKKYGYDSVEELESVVEQDRIPNTDLERIDQHLEQFF